jgi:hypothetical protein
MDRSVLSEHYEKRGFSKESLAEATAAVEAFESWLAGRRLSFEDCGLESLEAYLDGLLARGGASIEAMLGLARYAYLTGRAELYAHLAARISAPDIYAAIAERLEALEGRILRDKVMEGLDAPPPGSPPGAYPAATARLAERVAAELPPERRDRALKANAHRMPASHYAKDRERYLASPSIDAFLRESHDALVAALASHAAS